MHVSSRRESERPSRTVSDLIFRCLLAVSGVQTGYTPRREWVKLLSTAICFLTLTSVPFGGPYTVYKRISEPGISPRSLSDLVGTLTSVTHSSLSTYSIYVLYWKEREIEPLLRRKGRRCKDFILFLFCFVQIVIMDSIFIVNDMDFMSVMRNLAFARQDTSLLVMIMVYYDMLGHLVERLRLVHDLSKEPVINWRRMILEKWSVRDRLTRINTLFALPLSVLYLHLFVSAVFLWARAFENRLDLCTVCLLILSVSCASLQLTILACKTSEVRSQCVATEAELLRRLHEDRRLAQVDITVTDIFEFYDEWDSLRLGCFGHNLKNFSRYWSLLITCTAVVLQFDYVVVRAMSDLLKLSPSDNGSISWEV